MKIDSIDHVVLTVKDIEKTCEFYSKVMGMEIDVFCEAESSDLWNTEDQSAKTRTREHFNCDKPTSGSGDICFVTSLSLADVVAHLNSCGVKLVGGPVERNGARGLMMSVYFRDPDMNLIEVSHYPVV